MLFRSYGISQLPVSQDATGDSAGSLVGSITEKGLLDRAYRNPAVVERTVGEIMDRPLPVLAADAGLDDAFTILSGGAQALVAVQAGRAVGILTKLDVLEYLAHRRT